MARSLSSFCSAVGTDRSSTGIGQGRRHDRRSVYRIGCNDAGSSAHFGGSTDTSPRSDAFDQPTTAVTRFL